MVSSDGEKGAVYGKCIAANYQNVSKDMCAKEFMALKDCYLVWQVRMLLWTLTNDDVESGGQEEMNRSWEAKLRSRYVVLYVQRSLRAAITEISGEQNANFHHSLLLSRFRGHSIPPTFHALRIMSVHIMPIQRRTTGRVAGRNNEQTDEGQQLTIRLQPCAPRWCGRDLSRACGVRCRQLKTAILKRTI
jgi:hypothetical protein